MTTTDHECQTPWLFARLTDARLELLQLDRLPDDPASHEATVASLRGALGRALAEHRAAQLAELDAVFGSEPTSRDHQIALEFAAEQLEAARSSQPLPTAFWFPVQADGRDESGQVHVSVTADDVVILEVPHGLTDRLEVATAITQALNLAVARLDDDTMKRVNGLAAAPEPTDWAALAGQIDRFGLGKHREERPWM